MRKAIVYAVIAASFFIGATICRADEQVREDVAKGIAMMRLGDYQGAAKVLRQASESFPDDQQAAFYFAVALNRVAYDKEAESALKKALMATPEKVEVNFELGMNYYNREIYAEASDYFDNTIVLDPKSYYASQAREYLRKIEDREKEKPWDISFLAGMQYDSNVMLNGRNMPLQAGYSRKEDWSGIFNFRGSYALVKTPQGEVSASYSLYQSLHAKLDDFDINQNLLELAGLYTILPDIKLRGAYDFEYLFLGGDAYNTAHILSPSLILDHDDWGTTTIDYRFRTTGYRNSEKFPSNTDRNGDNHYGAISHIVPVSKMVALWGIYSIDRDITRQNYYDYLGNRLMLGCRAMLPFALSADLSAEAYLKKYKAEDPSYNATRDDKQYTLTVSLTRSLTEKYSLTMGTVFSRNDSNIEAFDYERALISLLFNVRL